MQAPGVLTQPSPYPVKETMDRLAAALTHNGATIYARIDQQAELRAVGQPILPLEFLLFGNPHAGAALMKTSALAALDLPLKVIAWEDDQHRVWVAFNEAAYLGKRYGLAPELTAPLDLTTLLHKVLGP